MSTEAAAKHDADVYRGFGPLPRVLSVSSRQVTEMTREQAYALCPEDSYVEYYGSQWLIVPFAPVEQPRFFICRPEAHSLAA
jgi:hypothetical protein